jgi:CDP-paratose 2-epimerase
MDYKTILITGGAGFVGSNLALLFRNAAPGVKVTALDNLRRRGSDLNVRRLESGGVQFFHGDVRCPEDFSDLPEFDLLIDCSAEPSVHAGVSGSPRYVLETNLVGTMNCLEAARQRRAAFLFLSTSRVYPIGLLNALPYKETVTRYSWLPKVGAPGFSERGVAEEFPIDGARSFYGASKLACEQLIQEYVHSYDLEAIINRCGVICGPWQMGKVDQGVITLWVAKHYFQQALRYIGFGGEGKQVRDVLHIEDLFDLLQLQLASKSLWDGRVYNVGGGNEISVSLRELTDLCAAETGNRVSIQSVPETTSVDLRIYITDSSKVKRELGWQPTRSTATIVHDIRSWLDQNAELVRPILAP